MTPDKETIAARLAEDRHNELVGLLKEVIGLMTIAAATVVREPDLEGVAERVADRLKEIE